MPAHNPATATESELDAEADEPRVDATEESDELRVVEPDEIEIVETEKEKQERKKREELPPRPKSNLGMMMAFFLVLFIMLDPNLRDATGNAVGYALEPLIGFGGEYPVATLLLAGVIMVTLSTIVRHFFMDWTKMARSQNTMRAFQKEFRAARMAKDVPRINELQKEQQKLMAMQSELTTSQMKPMAFTMLIIIPMFAWLWTYVSTVDYHWFTTPWNLRVDLYTREGIIFGSSILPHWILLYSVLSIPFGQILQKGLKVWSWRKRVDHIMSDEPDVHEPTD